MAACAASVLWFGVQAVIYQFQARSGLSADLVLQLEFVRNLAWVLASPALLRALPDTRAVLTINNDDLAGTLVVPATAAAAAAFPSPAAAIPSAFPTSPAGGAGSGASAASVRPSSPDGSVRTRSQAL